MRMGFMHKPLFCGVCLGGLELVGAAWAGGGHTKGTAHSTDQHSGVFLSSPRTTPRGVVRRFYFPLSIRNRRLSALRGHGRLRALRSGGLSVSPSLSPSLGRSSRLPVRCSARAELLWQGDKARTPRGRTPPGSAVGSPRPRPPQPPVPTTSLPAAEADKGRSGRSRASKWKSKQLSGTDTSCRGQCHLGRARRCPEGRGAGLRALAAHWGVLRAPTPPCLCPGHHHGLCSGGGKILGYGEPRLGPGQRLNLDKSQHHLCIYLTVAAPAPLEAEGKGTFLPSCPSPGTLCAPDLQRC